MTASTLLLCALLSTPEARLPLADWYVDAAAASCAAGDGSAATPFCTIAEAVAAAVDGDTIRIAPGTYVENLALKESVRLVGTDGRELTIVDGGGVGRVFEIRDDAAVTLDGLSIVNGAGSGVSVAGRLRLLNSTVSGNVAPGNGGGLLVGGSATVVNSNITDNTAGYYGGGIFTGGYLHVVGCYFARNVGLAPNFFGADAITVGGPQSGPPGLSSHGPSLTLENSTVTGHTGLAISALYSDMRIVNSTISANQTALVTGYGSVDVDSSTVVRNGDGWRHSSSPATVKNSVIADNGAAPDVRGWFVSLGHNLIGDLGTTQGFGAPGDQLGSPTTPLDPLLGPLATNGGPTPTHAPLAGSPLVNAGDPVSFEPTDQRGFARVGAMSAAGSAGVAGNGLTLSASSLPANALAIFLTSRASGFTAQPGGSSGNLCLAGALGRFVGPGQIQSTDASGALALALDLARHPTPTGLVPVLPGETWFYQAWHRDAVAGVATSNFSAATQVTFAP